MTTIVEGYLLVSKFFGVSLHKENSEWVSLRGDLFTKEMLKYNGKKIKIFIEEIK